MLSLNITEFYYWFPGIREFLLHPDSGAPADPSNRFYPGSSVPVSDPTKAGMTAKVQHFRMDNGLVAEPPWGGVWRMSGFAGQGSCEPDPPPPAPPRPAHTV